MTVQKHWWSRHGMVEIQLPVQSVPISTNVVSSNAAHGEVYSIKHYAIKFVSDLKQVSDFLRVLRFYSTNKTDCHYITEIKVALNTINQTNRMTVRRHWLLETWYCWRLIVHQQRFQPSDSNENVDFNVERTCGQQV